MWWAGPDCCPMNGMLQRVIASFALPDSPGAPEAIVYVPEGRNLITPLSQPKGILFNVPPERGPEIAANLDRQLQDMRTRNVIPWTDFEHTRKAPASGYPTRFFYREGDGVMAAMDWSGSGRVAVENRDVRYFSPEVWIDDDGVPVQLPDRGPLGGLVAEPAFRTIKPVAASDAGNENHDQPDPDKTMKLVFATCGLLSQSEAALETAETLAAQRVTALKADSAELVRVKASLADVEKERDELKDKVTAAEDEAKAQREKRASDLVTAAVTDGRIAPKDDKTKGFYIRLISAGDADAEEALAALPSVKPGDGTVRVVAADGDKSGEGEHAFIKESLKLVTAGQAADIDAAMDIVVTRNPQLYADYNKSLHG